MSRLILSIWKVLWQFYQDRKKGETPQPPDPPARPPSPPRPALDATPDRPVGFGYKAVVLCIPRATTESVAAALGLKNMQPANWASGVDAGYNDHVFVAPPLDGYVFVIGDNPDVLQDGSIAYYEALSKKLGEVQVFASHRVVDYCAWAMYRSGELVRAYAFSDGKVAYDFIADGEGETASEFYCPQEFAENYATDDFPLEDEEDHDPVKEEFELPCEDSPYLVAEAWSLNPLELEEREELGVGLVGSR